MASSATTLPEASDPPHPPPRPKIIFLIGGPGSGKGSIGGTLLTSPPDPSLPFHNNNLAHISIGDVLRDEISAGTPDGATIRQCMLDGGLLPWAMLLTYLRRGIGAAAAGQRTTEWWVLLDGFPRMVAQARLFEALEEYESTFAVYLECPEELMVERVVERAREKGQSARVDDNHATVRRRIEGFLAQTLPVVDYFAANGRLVKVSSTGTVEETYGKLVPLLKEKLRSWQYMKNDDDVRAERGV